MEIPKEPLERLATIKGFPGDCCLGIYSNNPDTFWIRTYIAKKVFRDEDLTENEEGKVIISLDGLGLDEIYNGRGPREFEMPKEILAKRKQKRKEREIRKPAIAMKEYKGKLLYFYIEDEKIVIRMFGYDETGRLKAELPEKTIEISEIENVYNKKALNIEELGFGHSHIEAPQEVVEKFEEILHERRLKNLKLIKVRVNKFNGYEYYKLNTDISDLDEWTWRDCKKYFEYFEGDEKFNGWLTRYPNRVLKIIK